MHRKPKSTGTDNLKFPARQPKHVLSYQGIPYYDWEVVPQDNGLSAVFRYASNEHEKGWVFHNFQDEFGFDIVSDAHSRDYLKAAFENKSWPIAAEVARDLGTKINKVYFDVRGEVLFKFEFGDIPSMRRGYFVVHVNAPEKILRIKQLPCHDYCNL